MGEQLRVSRYKTKILKPLSVLPVDEDYTVFDIETAPQDKDGRFPCGWKKGDLNSFFLGADIYDGKKHHHISESDGPGKLLQALLDHDYCLHYAHNGSKFDAKFLFGPLVRSGLKWEAAQAGQRIWITIFVGDQNINIWDSCAVLQASLAELGDYYDVDVKKDFWCENDYLKIRKKPWREYMERDTVSTFQVIEKARKEVRELGGYFSRSLASTAMSVFRARYLQKEIYCDTTMNSFERESLFGGRCQVFKERAGRSTLYDINSSYSTSACEPLPVRFIQTVAKTTHLEQAICRATVDIPPDAFPVLPARENGSLVFPTGQLTGVWCGPELLLAKELYGNRSVELHECAIYQMEPFLREYMLDLFEKKLAGNPTAKWMLNGLIGRFALRSEREKIVGPEDYPEIPERIQRQGRQPTLLNDFYHIWAVPTDSNSFAFPAVFSWDTSLSRVRLDRAFLANLEILCYGDTDSMLVEGVKARGIKIGKGLGEWKCEGTRPDFHALAPKLYQWGEKIRAKGVRRITKAEFERAARGEPLRVARLQGIRTLLRGCNFAPEMIISSKRPTKGKNNGRQQCRKRK